MFKIILFIAFINAVLLAQTSGFVVEPVEDTAHSAEDVDVKAPQEDENVKAPLEEVSNVAVAEPRASVNNFVNSKQFFLVTTEKVNWYRAAHICKFNGMELATIDSMEENNIVEMLIKMSGCRGEADRFWTSGNDLGAFRQWYWLANGRPMTFTNWGAGEPNNSNNTNERCVELRYRNNNWEWNDLPCSFEFYFICELKFN